MTTPPEDLTTTATNPDTTDKPAVLESAQTSEQKEVATLIESIMGENEWFHMVAPNGDDVHFKRGFGLMAYTRITVNHTVLGESDPNLTAYPKFQKTTFDVAKNGLAIPMAVMTEYTTSNGTHNPKKQETRLNVDINLLALLKSLNPEMGTGGGEISTIKRLVREATSFFDSMPTPLHTNPLNPTISEDFGRRIDF
jgi:hypothetical protein